MRYVPFLQKSMTLNNLELSMRYAIISNQNVIRWRATFGSRQLSLCVKQWWLRWSWSECHPSLASVCSLSVCSSSNGNTQLFIIIFIFWPTSTKPKAWILRNSYNGCNGCSFGRHGVLKRNRIPLLKSYRQVLEQKCGFPRVFGDDSDASPNLLYQLDSHGIPCLCRLYGYETEDVCAG